MLCVSVDIRRKLTAIVNKKAPHFLQPLTMEDFYTVYWEKQPLHIQRKEESRETMVDLATIETLLSSQAVFFPGIQLTQTGKVISVSEYADEQNRILPLRLFEFYAQGATIVLSQAQKLFAPMDELCREVIRTMQMRCQANIYVSPPGNQGFNAHYDTHDVFILQVSGAKTFNFYPSSVELPCPEEGFDSSKLASGDIDESISLSPGDTLYIPRGVVHDAVADSKMPSIHVTLGVYPVLMRDMLQEAIQCMSERDCRMRQSIDSYMSLPVHGNPGCLQASLASLMLDVRTFVDDPDNIKMFQARFHDELAIGASQDCRGLADRIDAVLWSEGNLSEEDSPAVKSIRLRKDVLINAERRSEGIKIRTFGQILEFDYPLAQTVGKLLDSGKLDKDELEELQTDQRIAVVKRLLHANLVELM